MSVSGEENKKKCHNLSNIHVIHDWQKHFVIKHKEPVNVKSISMQGMRMNVNWVILRLAVYMTRIHVNLFD